jgi:hypothetical protein
MKSLLDKLYIKEWKIGIVKATVDSVFSKSMDDYSFTWFSHHERGAFCADPFVYQLENGNYLIIYEEKKYFKKGTIRLTLFDNDLNIIQQKSLLDHGKHLSYPFIWKENNQIWILPESAEECCLKAYPLELEKLELGEPKILIDHCPLLDATMLHYENRYWIFSTLKKPGKETQLHLFHAEKWDGPYLPHQQNPVKSGLNGTRPAGSFFHYNERIIRPAQNADPYYGASTTLFVIDELNTETYRESPVKWIHPPQKSPYNKGLHTINSVGDVLVVDVLIKTFNPWLQFKLFLKRYFYK